MHFCMDEVWGFIMGFAALRFGWSYARTAWAARHKKPACCHEHEHTEEVTDDMIEEATDVAR
jgi:hypothetical protein